MSTLKSIRNLAGMTQKQLAEKSGISIRQIMEYESGECSIENMTSESAAAIASAFGCTIKELISINTSIFTSEMTKAIKSGDMTMLDAVAMSKYSKVRCLSRIGAFGCTFRANYERIPESITDKLSAEETAQLVDAFYDCYSDGKK